MTEKRSAATNQVLRHVAPARDVLDRLESDGATSGGYRDHYLTCNWRPTDSALHVLDLPPLRAKAAAAARMLILAEAVIIARADPGRWLSYSRRREFYATRPRRYRPPIYTFDTIVPVVDHLADIGLLEHQKMSPGNLGWQSRFMASPRLLHMVLDHPVTVVEEVGERIILRDHAGNLIDYNDTKQTRRWRRNLEKINALLRSAAIGLGGRAIREGDPLRVDRADVGLASNQLHRVFNQGSFSLGGRFYGGWWQNIPAECRSAITINGDPTLEMDYPRLHPTLLYDELGLAMHGDPYDLPGKPRPLVKLAFNTLVNADTRQAAIRAIANEIGGEGAFAAANALVSEIEAKHPQIAHMFASGAGRRLMRQDSDMTEHLLLRLEKQGVAALPIHDSYIVRQADKGALAETMAKTLQKFGRNSIEKSISYDNSIPQYGAGLCDGCGDVAARPPSLAYPAGAPPVGSIVMFLPERPQKSFFGPHEFAISISDIFDWHGGIAPAGIRWALRYEMERRGLTHADAAQRVGASRPQFENILQGRFGASQAVAGRIRDFLIEGAKTVGTSVE